MSIRIFATALTCAALSLLACSVSATPTTGTLTGKIYDTKGKPLAHARVILLDIGEETMTDDHGIYVFTAEDPRKCTVEVELEGYKTLDMSATIFANVTSELDLALAAGKPFAGRKLKPGEKDTAIIEVIGAQSRRDPWPDLFANGPLTGSQGDSALHSTARSR